MIFPDILDFFIYIIVLWLIPFSELCNSMKRLINNFPAEDDFFVFDRI